MNTATTTFDILVHSTFTRDEIPPRCRKPRRVSHDIDVQVQIPVMDLDHAPVAFTVEHALIKTDYVIREYQGQLYRQLMRSDRIALNGQDDAPVVAGGGDFPTEVSASQTGFYGADSAEEAAANAEKWASVFAVDTEGFVWKRAAEPCYYVTTFGLGGNHGGTSLMVGDVFDCRNGQVFRSDEFESALAHAIEVAENRGDTRDVRAFTERPEGYRRITVHRPESVKVVTASPAPKDIEDMRWDYRSTLRSLAEADNPTDEARIFADACTLREQIIAQGYAPAAGGMDPYEDR